MSDYIHLFETQAAHDAVYNGSEYTEPWVGLVTANNTLSYNDADHYYKISLTFEILSDGNITWKKDSGGYENTINYKKNNGDWTQLLPSTSGTTVSVLTGDIISFKGDSQNYFNHYFTSTARFNVCGNIMSLIDSTNYLNVTSAPSSAFQGLFHNCTNLINAKNLILPAVTANTACYQNMFKGCTSLLTAPKILAETLGDSCCASMFEGCTSLIKTPEFKAFMLATKCYSQMFKNCTNLTQVSELPVKGMKTNCYSSMFSGCTSLTTAPELPATTLAKHCYEAMFYNCTSLNYIKCLATNISAEDCVRIWTYNVAQNGTFVKDSNMTNWTSDYNGIPSGWTVQDAS